MSTQLGDELALISIHVNGIIVQMYENPTPMLDEEQCYRHDQLTGPFDDLFESLKSIIFVMKTTMHDT
jgi:hypothetical protein